MLSWTWINEIGPVAALAINSIKSGCTTSRSPAAASASEDGLQPSEVLLAMQRLGVGLNRTEYGHQNKFMFAHG